MIIIIIFIKGREKQRCCTYTYIYICTCRSKNTKEGHCTSQKNDQYIYIVSLDNKRTTRYVCNFDHHIIQSKKILKIHALGTCLDAYFENILLFLCLVCCWGFYFPCRTSRIQNRNSENHKKRKMRKKRTFAFLFIFSNHTPQVRIKDDLLWFVTVLMVF